MVGQSFLVAAVAVVSTFTGVAPASAAGAAPPATADRRDDRVVVVRYSSPTRARLSGTPSRRGCHRISGTITGYNVLRAPQWGFTQTAIWCWARGRITYKYSDATVTSPGHFWRFVGWSANSSSAGSASPWVRYRQAHFAQCIPLLTGGDLCGHEAHPWMRFFMYGNGTWHIDHS